MAKVTLTQQVAALTAQVSALLQAQHSTPTAVAEKVTEATPAPAPQPVQVAPVKTQADLARDFVSSKGLAFARGGRTMLTTEALKAAVGVLKTGQPVVVTQSGLGSLDKRNIVGVVIFRTDDGSGVATQYLYRPEAE